MYSTVLGSAQPHGSDTVSRNTHVGTGQRIGSQPPGWVCLVTVGHGVVVGLGGSVVILVVMIGLVVLVDVEEVEVEVEVLVVGLGLGEHMSATVDIDRYDSEFPSSGGFLTCECAAWYLWKWMSTTWSWSWDTAVWSCGIRYRNRRMDIRHCMARGEMLSALPPGSRRGFGSSSRTGSHPHRSPCYSSG